MVRQMNQTAHINNTDNSNTDLSGTVLKVREAQVNWAAEPVGERVRRIRKIRDHITVRASEIAETISKETGKVLTDALAAEVLPAALAVSYYCKNAGRFLSPEKLRSGNLALSYKRSRLYRQPFGVIGIISPWNYPFAIPFSEIVMALLAGNAVLLKTASNMPAVTQKLMECIGSADLPDGLFQNIDLPGQLAGDALLDGGIDKLFFTGSVATGKYLMKKAAEKLTPLVLELGGNDAMIVCADADLERAVGGVIWAGFSSAGQSCGGIERIYADDEIHDLFIEKLKQRIAKIHTEGSPYERELGAITTEKQYRHIKKQVSEALEKGAVIAAQSEIPTDGKRRYFPATVLVNVTHDMTVMRDETFGPVVTVMPFKTVEEAVHLANDSYLGLTGSVWSKNRQKAITIGRQIKAGVITINDHLMSHGLAETPWGGFKQSGIGRTHGKPGFDEMTQLQVVVDDRLSFARKNLWWSPYSRKLYDGLSGLIQFMYGRGFRRRLSGLKNLMKIFFRIF